MHPNPNFYFYFYSPERPPCLFLFFNSPMNPPLRPRLRAHGIEYRDAHGIEELQELAYKIPIGTPASPPKPAPRSSAQHATPSAPHQMRALQLAAQKERFLAQQQKVFDHQPAGGRQRQPPGDPPPAAGGMCAHKSVRGQCLGKLAPDLRFCASTTRQTSLYPGYFHCILDIFTSQLLVTPHAV